MVKKNQVIIGGICVIGVLSVGILAITKIKYKEADSINIANSTVNYDAIKNNMVAMYKSEDGTNYTEITDRMPNGSEYIINESKSYCNISGGKDNNAILKTVDGNHVISNLIKGDKCYLYFDKKKVTSEDKIVALKITVNETTPDFSQVATTDEGVFKVSDGMYGGYSYYWRGAATTNYVKFANFCWRIVRINGDGSIRLIYDGTTCHANGTTGQSGTDSIVASSQTYSKGAVYDRSEYGGYTYTEGSQRGTTDASNLKTQTENWYNKYIAGTASDSAAGLKERGYDAKVATGKFCNDRETASGYTWESQPSSTFYYAAYGRLGSAKKPALSCTNTSDIYNLKAGAITADEVAFAGGVVGSSNSLYYLYSGQYYWTMSPFCLYINSNNYNVSVFLEYGDGQLNPLYVGGSFGVRPVINLTSDTQFKSGTDGTLNNPYEVI